MIFFKLYYHVIAFLKFILFKIVYRNKVHFGANFTFRKGFSLDIGKKGRVEIGKNVFFNNWCSVCALESVKIGDGTIFGENVKIYDHNHICSNPNIPIKEQGYNSSPIHIGKHCWIASNVIILKGVTIGDNSIIGAGVIVYKDVPPNSKIVGKQ